MTDLETGLQMTSLEGKAPRGELAVHPAPRQIKPWAAARGDRVVRSKGRNPSGRVSHLER